MVGGFNTNVRYRGRTYHVQTEDSGPNVRKIVTLLYEGGTILYSRKTAYDQEHAGNREAVRGLMEQQHCEMVESLKTGGLDAEIGLRPGTDTETGSQPVVEPVEPLVGAVPSAAPVPTSTAPEARPDAAMPMSMPVPVARLRRTRPGEDGPQRDFGTGVITQKPLDEVVLAHLAPK